MGISDVFPLGRSVETSIIINMKVVILTSNYYLAANIALKTFLEHRLLRRHKIEVAGVVAIANAEANAKTLQTGYRFLKRSGPWFFLNVVLLTIWQKWILRLARYFIPNRMRHDFELEELAARHNVPYLQVSDINSQEAHDFISSKTPDYLVSSLLLQILKPNILALPSKGSINFHPALFQRHRGIFANFWTLIKNWKQGGATVHFMTNKIDGGKVIIQKRFLVKKSDTMFDVNIKSAKLGGKLLAKALAKLNQNEAAGFSLKKLSKIFTTPAWSEVKEFIKRKKSFIKLKDIFRI